ncbi:MAG: glycosyltransferase family 2 protein [bacterium]
MPLVSIGLPVYNGENFLDEAIYSILAQTCKDFELIISDNASTDGTPEICRAYAAQDARIRYYRQASNRGAIANFNFVFERAAGRYFKWAAHDDVIAPTFLECCVQVLEHRPESVLCFPAISYINEQCLVQKTVSCDLSIRAQTPVDRLKAFVNHQLDRNDIFWAVFGLMRSEALRRAGPLGKYVASDQVLLVKLLLLGQFHQHPESLYARRVHPLASTVRLPKLRMYRERAAWYDAGTTARLVLPNWRLLLEIFSAIRDDRLLQRGKVGCYYPIAKMFFRRWKRLARELMFIPTQILEHGYKWQPPRHFSTH